jgi:hypothetical protein
LVENACFDYAVSASLDSEYQQETLTSIKNCDSNTQSLGNGPSNGARWAHVGHSSSALQEYSPESYLNHVYATEPSAGARLADVGYRGSASQEYGSHTLLFFLDHCCGLSEFKNKCIVFQVSPFVFIAVH